MSDQTNAVSLSIDTKDQTLQYLEISYSIIFLFFLNRVTMSQLLVDLYTPPQNPPYFTKVIKNNCFVQLGLIFTLSPND